MTLHINTRRAILRDREYGYSARGIARLRRLPIDVVRRELREFNARKRGWR